LRSAMEPIKSPVATGQGHGSSGVVTSWRRLGDFGLALVLLLFAMMRAMAAYDAWRDGDWLAAAHHAIIGAAMLIMAVLPIIRRTAVARGGGITPKAIAFVGGYSIIPLGLLPLTWRPDWLLAVSTLGIIAMTCFEIWALLTLRRSFSVFPEARQLVTHGPYGWIRHPLYSVYLVSYTLVVLPRLSVAAVLIAGLAIAAQVLRSRQEEQVLRSVFPEYDEYAGRVPAFLPRLGRSDRAARPTTADAVEAMDPPDDALAA
jgi:protein-S-isoprenylcysteine O-methyltransferase Ste14